MDLFESTLTSERVFSGSVLGLRVDTVRLPDGREGVREIAEHGGGVCICALTDVGDVYMVEQYRYSAGQKLTELPAGKLEPGEEPGVCAARELAEEIGVSAAEWIPLGHILPSPGCYTEVIHLYLALELSDVTAGTTDPDEFLQVRKIPFGEAVRMAAEGELDDAKTVAALFRAMVYLGTIE